MQAAFDWGAPRPADWGGPRERIVTTVPLHVANDLRRRAADQGISVSMLVNRMLADAFEHDDVVVSAAAWPSAVDLLIG